MFVFRHLYWPALGLLIGYTLSCSTTCCTVTAFPFKRALTSSHLFLSPPPSLPLLPVSFSSTTLVPRDQSLPLFLPLLSPLLITLLYESYCMAQILLAAFFKLQHLYCSYSNGYGILSLWNSRCCI